MNKKALNWLYGELPSLVDSGVIDQASADRLRQHYGTPASDSRQLARVLIAVLGTLLVGLGIVLMIAHNWDDLSRPMRLVLAFTPLVFAQGLAGWALWKRTPSYPLNEGSAILVITTLAAAISLVSQIYHIPGNLEHFLFVWTLISLPSVYIMGSSGAAMIVMAGWLVWVLNVSETDGQQFYFLLFMALMVPHLWSVGRRGIDTPHFVMLGWMFALCLVGGILLITIKKYEDLWSVTSLSVLGIYCLGSRLWLPSTRSLGRQPFRAVALYGIPLLSFILTYENQWKHIESLQAHLAGTLMAVVILAAWVVIVGLTAAGYRFKDFLYGSAPLWAVLALALSGMFDRSTPGVVIFNLYALALGIKTLVSGIQKNRLPTINGGMAILSIWIMLRFLDEDISFLVRGTLFILLGSAFLFVNLRSMRRKEPVQ